MSSTVTGARPVTFRVDPTVIVLCILVGVFAFAAGYGWFGESRDYADYLNIYNSLTPHNLLSGYRFERGYMLTSWACKIYLGMDFAEYYTLLVAVSLTLKFRLLWKYASAPVIAALVYLLLLFPLHEYTQLRAAVAFAFAYCAIDAYLEGKLLFAFLLLAVATSFHALAVVLTAGSMLVLFVSRRSPAFVAAFFLLIAGASSFMVSTAMHVLEKVNPLISTYVKKAFLNQSPNLLSGENILLVLLIASSALFQRPWQRRNDGFFYFLSFWTLIAYLAFLQIPIFAHRIREGFIFALFFFTFRFDDSHQSRIPAALLILTSGWMLYESIAEGLLLVYSR